jgi:3-isopropylmalate dehydratase
MPSAEGTPQTLYDKVLQAHVVDEKFDGTLLLYIGTFSSRLSSSAFGGRLKACLTFLVANRSTSCT